MNKKKEESKITIDGTEYSLDSLSDKAKSIVGFVVRLDKEALEMRFQLEKSLLARKQAVLNLKSVVKEK